MTLTAKALGIIHAYLPLGERRLKNGAHLIGHIPHRAPEAYLHTLFQAAPSAVIDGMRAKFSATQAFEQYSHFLVECNGANFFLGSLVLNGIRLGPLSRSSDDRQPFDLYEINSFERPKNSDPQSLYIGSYNWDGSLIYLEPDGEVLVCRKGDASPYARWSNLSGMITTEVERLAQFYDQQGRLIDKSTPRSPVPNLESDS